MKILSATDYFIQGDVRTILGNTYPTIYRPGFPQHMSKGPILQSAGLGSLKFENSLSNLAYICFIRSHVNDLM